MQAQPLMSTRVIDQDREIQQLRDEALLRDQQQTDRIMELLKFD